MTSSITLDNNRLKKLKEDFTAAKNEIKRKLNECFCCLFKRRNEIIVKASNEMK